MPNNQLSEKLQFELVFVDNNSIALKSAKGITIPKVIIHCFEQNDLEKLNSLGKEISLQYKHQTEKPLVKSLIALKDFLMM